MESDLARGFQVALKEARQGGSEGGVPIGAAIVTRDLEVIGWGHNMRHQKGSNTLHAEISALENAGRLPSSKFAGATMYTTLSPCDMCTGACLLFKFERVVIGENKNFTGGEQLLRDRGIRVVVLDNQECRDLMADFIQHQPELWNEDIAV